MKIKLARFLMAMASVTLLGFPRPADADSQSLIVRADIISVPKEIAESLLEGAEIKTNPAGILDKLRELVGRHEATSIASPTARSRIGSRDLVKGPVFIEWETAQKDKSISLTALIKSGEDQINTSLPITLGKVVFLGSFDPAKPSNGVGGAGTYFVFLRFQ